MTADLQVFWITPTGAVHDAFLYTPNAWGSFELAPPGSAAPGAITCVSRAKNAMEVRLAPLASKVLALEGLRSRHRSDDPVSQLYTANMLQHLNANETRPVVARLLQSWV